MQNDSPLKNSLSRNQVTAILIGFFVLMAVVWSLLARRSSTTVAWKPVEMPAVVKEDIGPDDLGNSTSRPTPTTDEQRDRQERLDALLHSARLAAQKGS